MQFTIEPLTKADLPVYNAHFQRHRAESGVGDIHFMPFAPDDPDGPKGLTPNALGIEVTEPGWQRWWVAWDAKHRTIIGHVDLKAMHLRTVLHRCELGIGIERAHRGQGVGRQLMCAAIDFCRFTGSIDWLDLRVFAHNKNARALYADLGFREIVTLCDWARIGELSIDDVLMSLDVSSDEKHR